MIYLDSSALMKLVRAESETPALHEWLDGQADGRVATSELGRVEVLRAARRAGDPALRAARALLGYVDLVRLDQVVQDIACDIGDPLLRTLDALHLASAIVLGDVLSVFVAYDHRLLAAARAADLATLAPGG